MLFDGQLVLARLFLRGLTSADCGQAYQNWLNDKEVNCYLETRFTAQTIPMIADFVRTQNESSHSWLFGIFTVAENKHIGNIKLGPVHPIYRFADVSYFIGDKLSWGRGYASEAIGAVTRFGFQQLGLYRIQAGVHGTNAGSAKALQKNGYLLEATLRKKLFYGDDCEKNRDDHLYYGILKEDWERQ